MVKVSGRSRKRQMWNSIQLFELTTSKHIWRTTSIEMVWIPKNNDDSEAISKFLCVEVSFVNTLDAHLEVEKPLFFAIDKNAVEKIIGDILFDPEDEDE